MQGTRAPAELVSAGLNLDVGLEWISYPLDAPSEANQQSECRKRERTRLRVDSQAVEALFDHQRNASQNMANTQVNPHCHAIEEGDQ